MLKRDIEVRVRIFPETIAPGMVGAILAIAPKRPVFSDRANTRFVPALERSLF